MGVLSKIYNKYLEKIARKSFMKNATLLGSKYEFKRGCYIALQEGSVKEDVVLADDVSLLSDSILISCRGGKIFLGEHVKMQSSKILCVNHIEIGDYTAIASNVVISDNNNHPINPEFRRFMRTTPHGSDARSWYHSDNAPIKIGQNVWVGQNVRIQKGVTIGDNSIIAANSVVTKSVPANCIAAGNPARVVKTDIDKIAAPTTCEAFNNYIASK